MLCYVPTYHHFVAKKDKSKMVRTIADLNTIAG